MPRLVFPPLLILGLLSPAVRKVDIYNALRDVSQSSSGYDNLNIDVSNCQITLS